MGQKSLRRLYATVLLAWVSVIGAAACSDGPDPLVGTWKLESASCNGKAVTLSGGFLNFTLTYNSDGTFTSEFDKTSCSVKVSGTWTRDGLSVTESETQLDCGPSGCNNELAPQCDTATGIVSVSGTHTYFANVPGDELEQTKHNVPTVCQNGDNEVQDYARQ